LRTLVKGSASPGRHDEDGTNLSLGHINWGGGGRSGICGSEGGLKKEISFGFGEEIVVARRNRPMPPLLPQNIRLSKNIFKHGYLSGH